MREQTVIQITKSWVSRAFGHKPKSLAVEAHTTSEFTRIREERRAALNAFRRAIDARDTRLQRSTQLAAIQATNAALRAGR